MFTVNFHNYFIAFLEMCSLVIDLSTEKDNVFKTT